MAKLQWCFSLVRTGQNSPQMERISSAELTAELTAVFGFLAKLSQFDMGNALVQPN